MSISIDRMVAESLPALKANIDAIERTILRRGLNTPTVVALGGAGLALGARLNNRTGLSDETDFDIDLFMDEEALEVLAHTHGVPLQDKDRKVELPGDDDCLPVSAFSAQRNPLDFEDRFPKMVARAIFLPPLGIHVFQPSDIASTKADRAKPKDFVGLIAAQLRNPGLQGEEAWMTCVEQAIALDRKDGDSIENPPKWLVELRANDYQHPALVMPWDLETWTGY